MPSGRNKCLLMESDDGIALRDVDNTPHVVSILLLSWIAE